MSRAVVKISTESHQVLRDLADKAGTTMQAVLETAIEQERRRRFFEEANESYAALRRDPVAWAEWRAELEPWESLPDGLPVEEPLP